MNKPILSEEDLKDFYKARELYFIARAINETNLKIGFDSKKAVLKLYPFMNTENGKRILNPDLDYMMSDQVFNDKYLRLLHEEHIKRGLKDAEFNKTADHISYKLLKDAEENLINEGLKLLPDQQKAKEIKEGLYLWDIREKILNLMCCFNADKTRTAKEILKDIIKGGAA